MSVFTPLFERSSW